MSERSASLSLSRAGLHPTVWKQSLDLRIPPYGPAFWSLSVFSNFEWDAPPVSLGPHALACPLPLALPVCGELPCAAHLAKAQGHLFTRQPPWLHPSPSLYQVPPRLPPRNLHILSLLATFHAGARCEWPSSHLSHCSSFGGCLPVSDLSLSKPPPHSNPAIDGC